MRILFAAPVPLEKGPEGFTSIVASARYRIIIPAQQLARQGHQVQVAAPVNGSWPDEISKFPMDVLVVGKTWFPSTLNLISEVKARGVRVVVDFCDDDFAHPELGPLFRQLAAAADALVAATPAMAAAIARHAGREAVVITDPVEGPRGFPAFAPRFPALRLAWFGHVSNLAGLMACAQELQSLAAQMPVALELVTAANYHSHVAMESLQGLAPGRLAVTFTPWSVAATWQALGRCDIAWIPVLDDERSAVKSPNRLLEALWAGKLAIAGTLPSYVPYGDLVPVGRGLVEAVADALADPAATQERIREAQRRIARDHSAFECGRRWAEVAGDREQRALKLNLGCGDKILPGYVNVDVVEARAGYRPDVICDLHDLAPFRDASVDEILSVHVVEHFWRWEVRDVLREWVRVLKPGAKMIVECPNLHSACQTFLVDPRANARETQEGQRTMWVFYGDPSWKDPLMVHRWGYTPESLKELLEEVGLADVKQEPAQFKLREPRDMRMVGVKR